MKIIDKLHQYYLDFIANCPWSKEAFKDIYFMQNDTKGKFGEIIISEAFHNLGYEINEDISDKNHHPDGIYDIKVNNLRIEIKTASISDNKWQHEPLYKEEENVCDGLIFIDFDYNNFYMSMVKNSELPIEKTVYSLFGRKHGTLRKKKQDGYKIDFSHTTIETLMKANRCKKFDKNASIEEVEQFLEEHFSDLL